jgi:SAM-dependent methyltransferase
VAGARRGFNVATRLREPELMDGAHLDRELHLRALDALARINRVSRTSVRVWAEVERLWKDGARPVRVLDVACGGGDVLIDLARRARRCGVAVDLLGCDLSPVALDRARARAGDEAGIPGAVAPGDAALRFEQLDVVEGALPSERHLLLSSLFLHHLSREQAIAHLRSRAASCEKVLLVQDLRRTRLGYALARLGLHTLTRSTVARFDGLVSVRAAFTIEEVGKLARDAGLAGAQVRPCWPQRFALRWARVSRTDS